MKKGILLASFGVGNIQAKEKCIDTVTADVKKNFPDCEVAEAWTAVFLRKKLAKQGVEMFSITEALEKMAANGVEEIVVQPTHLTQGEEFIKKIVPEVASFKDKFKKITLGTPILPSDSYENYFSLLNMLLPLQELKADEELVMVGHGSPNIHNVAYEWLQKAADERDLPVHIGVVEDSDFPNKQDVLKRLQDAGVKKVYLCPLLLSGGEHATVDMAGDEPESWKNVISDIGIDVRCNVSGLGEKADYRQLYVEKIKALI